jgi:hypothetical protein
MARIPNVSRETMPDDRTDLCDGLVLEHGANSENVFLALANVPDLAEAVLGIARHCGNKQRSPGCSASLPW